MKYLAPAIGLALLSASFAGNAQADETRAIGTVEGYCDHKHTSRFIDDSAHKLIACLIVDASRINLDSPDAAKSFAKGYGYEITPELLADWQVNPHHALGTEDGFAPVRMENVQFEYTPTSDDGGPMNARLGTWHIEGDWISSKGSEWRKRPLRLTISGHVLSDVIWDEQP